MNSDREIRGPGRAAVYRVIRRRLQELTGQGLTSLILVRASRYFTRLALIRIRSKSLNHAIHRRSQDVQLRLALENSVHFFAIAIGFRLLLFHWVYSDLGCRN